MPAPEKYKTAGVLMIVAGIFNILISLIWVCALGGSLYLTLCCWVPLIPACIGGLEIYTGMKVQRGEPMFNAKIVSILGAVSGIMMCYGVIPMIAEIVAFVLMSSIESAQWLEARKMDALEG